MKSTGRPQIVPVFRDAGCDQMKGVRVASFPQCKFAPVFVFFAQDASRVAPEQQ